MPRVVPDLHVQLRHEVQRTQDLLVQFEYAKARQPEANAPRITMRSIDLVYELAYLNAFKKWEDVLEQCFVRFLCGYENGSGAPVFVQGQTRASNLGAGLTKLLGTKDYLLRHNPNVVIQRSRAYFVNGSVEMVIGSKVADLENYANIRHRIAHGQEDSRRKFDRSTMTLCGRRYQRSSAGRFLRDWVPNSAPKVRWFDEIALTLVSLAQQITS